MAVYYQTTEVAEGTYRARRARTVHAYLVMRPHAQATKRP